MTPIDGGLSFMRDGDLISNGHNEKRIIRGAHAPRMLVSAPSPKCLLYTRATSPFVEEKFAMTRASSPAREGACAPQNWRALDDFCSLCIVLAQPCRNSSLRPM